MEIFNVDIYIETSLKGPARRRAAGMYLLQFITDSGDAVTRDGIIYREQATENALTLELMGEALSRLTKTCSVWVVTGCRHILSAMEVHEQTHESWLSKWKKNGWVAADGEPVKNLSLWQQVSGLMDRRMVGVEDRDHGYKSVMAAEIKKELNALHSLPVEKKKDVCAMSRDPVRCPGREAP